MFNKRQIRRTRRPRQRYNSGKRRSNGAFVPRVFMNYSFRMVSRLTLKTKSFHSYRSLFLLGDLQEQRQAISTDSPEVPSS
ncbi:hypothetical protein TNCV_681251 [Trichonephila clavipes]|nr:hypothetical protein TNCV_681251 [Trichonephila clavipes]